MSKKIKLLPEKIFSILNSLNKAERTQFLGTLNPNSRKKSRLHLFAKYLCDFTIDGKKSNKIPEQKKMHLLVAKKGINFSTPSRPIQEYNKYLYDELLIYLHELQKNRVNFSIEKDLEQLAAIQSHSTSLEHFQQLASKIKKDIIATEYQDIRYYQQLSSLYQTIYEHPLYNSFKENNEVLAQLIDSQNNLYLAKTLKYRCEQFNTTNVIGQYDFEDKRYISTVTLQTLTFKPQYANYYYQQLLNLLIEGANLSKTEFLIQKLKQHINQLRRKEANDISILLFNYCNYFTSGIEGKAYQNLAAEMIITRIESKVLNILNEPINSTTFINVVICGLRVRNPKWVEDFITKAQHQIKEDEKDLMLKLAKTRIYSAQNKPIEAYQVIFDLYEFQKRDEDYPRGLLIRWTLMKCCFNLRETNSHDIDNLDKHAHAFNHWLNVQLKAKKLLPKRVKSYKKAIYFIKKLHKANLNDKVQKSNLLAEINETDILAGRKWFTEQLQ